MIGRKLTRRQWLAERMDRLCDRKIRLECRIMNLRIQHHEQGNDFYLIMLNTKYEQIARIDRELVECQDELASLINAELDSTI